MATGVTLSSTVTVDVAVDTLPLLSVTVRVTRFGPMFEQSKSVLSSVNEAMPQASELPLSICASVIDALPAASS